MISSGSRVEGLKSALEDGTIDAAGKMGVTIDTGDLGGNESTVKNILSKNPISQANNSLFGGLIRKYKLDLVQQVAKDYDLTDPEQLKEAQKIGSQINNWFGGLNYTVLNRNPSFQTAVKFMGLAPDFNEGKLRNLLTSANITDWSPSANFARKALVGEAVAVGLISELGRRVVTGKFDGNFKDLVTNTILNPNIPLPSQFNNPQTGKSQVANMPSSTFGDLFR